MCRDACLWTPKVILWTYRKFLCFSAGKKIDFIPHPYPHAFLEILQDLQICYEYAWLQTPKMIVSICKRLRGLSACQNKNSSFTSSLRCYILNNHAIWLADSIWPITQDQGFCQIWDWWWNINNNISFHFILFPRKINDKKKLYWGHFWQFLPKFGQK